jgi:hypothetical protein
MGRTNAGSVVIFAYKFFQYNDLTGFFTGVKKNDVPIDFTAVIGKIIYHESNENIQIYPPPPPFPY